MSKKSKKNPSGVYGNVDAKEEEIQEPIKVSWFDKIPYWVKAVFVKYWFFGAIYFFFVMGITSFVGNAYEVVWRTVTVCLAIGFMNDLLINHILSFMEWKKGEASYWWMFKNKKFYSLLINLAYGGVLGLAAQTVCALIANQINDQNWLWVCREPLTFALVALAIDLALIWLKNWIVYLVKRRKSPEEGELL